MSIPSYVPIHILPSIVSRVFQTALLDNPSAVVKLPGLPVLGSILYNPPCATAAQICPCLSSIIFRIACEGPDDITNF